MKVYRGYRIQDNLPMDSANQARVLVGDENHPHIVGELQMSALGRSKSPDGFNWGYCGSGPSALAHSILADCVSDAYANAHWLRFLGLVVSRWPQSRCWRITENEIIKALQLST